MKALNTKRILSAALAGAMALSLAATALAAEGDDTTPTTPAQDPNSTIITATYEEIEIDVVVPNAGTAQINPYGLPVDVNKSTEGEKATISGQQIVTQPMYIKSKMGLDLQVDATLTGKVTGACKLAASKDAITGKAATEASGTEGEADYVPAKPAVPAATTASAFVYLQAKASAVTGAEDTESDKTLSDALIDEFAAWSGDYVEGKDLVLATKAAKMENFATLKAATMDETSGEFSEYAAGSIVLYRLAGDVVEAPKTPWAEADGFSATVAFTFKPVVSE